jgi:hypothetical protein
MTSTKAPERNGTEQQTFIGRTTTVVTDVGQQVHTTASDATAVVARHAPAALAASRGTLDRALATLRGSSSGSLALGTFFAAGVTGGMFLSRAPRVLVALAFLPALLLGGTALGRGTTRLEEPSRGART